MRLLVLTAFALFALTEPAYAQAWAQKAVSVGEQFVNGLKILGRVIATIVGIWGAYEIMSGRKRFADMMNWFVGAVVFVSINEVVNLMLGAFLPSKSKLPRSFAGQPVPICCLACR